MKKATKGRCDICEEKKDVLPFNCGMVCEECAGEISDSNMEKTKR